MKGLITKESRGPLSIFKLSTPRALKEEKNTHVYTCTHKHAFCPKIQIAHFIEYKNVSGKFGLELTS